MKPGSPTTTIPITINYGERTLPTDFTPPAPKFTLKFPNKSIETAYRDAIIFGHSQSKVPYENPYVSKHNFFMCYYGIVILYTLFYIFNYVTDNVTKEIFEFQMCFMLGITFINSLVFILAFLGRFLRRLRSDLLQFTYISTAIALIVCDTHIQNWIFGGDPQNCFSCMFGLIMMLAISKFILHTNYLEYAIWSLLIDILFLVVHLQIDRPIELTLCEAGSYLLMVIFETKTFYREEIRARTNFNIVRGCTTIPESDPKKPEDEKPKSEIEEVAIGVRESIEVIETMLDKTPSDLRPKLSKVFDHLNKFMKLLGSKNNIYSTDIEILTKGMDKDDQLFIQQTWSNHNMLEVRRPNKFRTLKTSEVTMKYDVDELIGILKQVGKQWNFNTFFLKECTEGRPLVIIGKYCIQKYRLDEAFNLDDDLYISFLEELEMHYKANPYHNSAHAADVLASFFYFVSKSRLAEYLTEIEILTSVIANLGHDVAHPGYTNRFLINKKDELAIRYNDISVLESMHSAIVFQLMQDSDKNILKHLDTEHWCVARKQIIDMILATDMGRHFDLLGQFRAKTVNNPLKPLDTPEQRIDVMKMSIKAADIGHSAKILDLHERWTLLVCEEFFTQGDLEKKSNLPVSMYCDREATDVTKSQAGFIKNIAVPLYRALNDYLESEDIEKCCIGQLKSNLEHWENSYKRYRLVKNFEDEGPINEYDELIKRYSKQKRCGTQAPKRREIEENAWSD
ncbi:unnamed protein product [Blepharisma stoltei]|uniref:Phosphodiesterase n=1 Tax=Blepharisma stoltei TaxID=1481888 RepID=A0AAU9JRH4_9CILI|nr:unnamed protein product [Blepharisma stoltei]